MRSDLRSPSVHGKQPTSKRITLIIKDRTIHQLPSLRNESDECNESDQGSEVEKEGVVAKKKEKG
jgi:hypothetical protein